MTSPTSKSTRFDNLYANVPAEQVDRLKQFRRTHPPKQQVVGETTWEFIACGQGNERLLLLPGALSIGESMFPLITAFENQYQVIAPSYPLSLKMKGLCDGIASILEAEGVTQAHVFGGSYGGLVAQYFARAHQAMSSSLILSHTFVLTPKLRKPLWVAGKLFPVFPKRLLRPLLKLRLNRMLLATLRAAKHPEAEFWRAYLDEAIASDLLKQVFIHQNKCLLDLTQQPQFTPDDLKGWPGRILIIDSDDDPAIGARDRDLLRRMYPSAQLRSFTDAGHASSILKREEVVALIKSFMREQA